MRSQKCRWGVCVAVALVIMALCAGPTSAQQQPVAQKDVLPAGHQDMLPIEAALLYSWLIKEEPNFDYLVFTNPAFAADPSKFGQQALIEQQRKGLETLFKKINAKKMITANHVMGIAGAQPDGSLVLTGLSPDRPFIYELTPSDRYGVFVRNVKEVLQPKPPFLVLHSTYVQSMLPQTRLRLPVQLVLRPVAGDRDIFTLDDGQTVRPIIADVVQLTVFDSRASMILLQQRFKNWTPETAKNPLQGLLTEELKTGAIAGVTEPE